MRKRQTKSGLLPPAFLLCCVLVWPTSAQDQPGPADARSIEYNRWHTLEPGQFGSYNQRASLVQRGRIVYNQNCVGCHGEKGDGKGPAAQRLLTKPRDFTSGIYKFRSTDSGSLPLDTDLHRTITRGLPGSAMPGFPLMPEGDKLAVIAYVKHFYANWDAEAATRKRVFVPQAPPPEEMRSEERRLRGHVVYLTLQCHKCHGTDGRGRHATQTQYVDAWGNPQKPFDFTRGRLKGGDDPEDIYRTFHTGLQSIMPAFGTRATASANAQTFDDQRSLLDEKEVAALLPYAAQFPATPADIFGKMSEAEMEVIGQRNSWDLVAYILSLRTRSTTAPAVLGFEWPAHEPTTEPAAAPAPPAKPVVEEDY